MIRDARLAIRRFWHNPARTGAMILIVGVGIGAATAVFSVVDQTILRPPPFAHPDRLVQVMDVYRAAGARSTTLTLEKIAGWQRQPALFEAFEGYTHGQMDLTGDAIEPERVSGLIVTNGLLRMLGVQPALGRGFAADDGSPERDRVVLIGEQLWKRRFGGRDDVLGMRIELSGESHTIVGVMPRRVRIGGADEELWVPVDVAHGAPAGVPNRFTGLARLTRGVHPSARQALADSIAARLQQERPLAAEPFWDIHLDPKKVAYVPAATRTALFVLLGAVGFVLLITCANTASLLLSQIGARQRETAIRAAIGASRFRLFREVVTESVLLAACGGAVGVLLAIWAVEAIVTAAPPNLTFNATRPIEVDFRILAIAGLMTFVTGLLLGLLPAIRGSVPNAGVVLKSAIGSPPRSHGRFAGALVVAEVAFSLILLVGAALMVRTFVNLHRLAPGFDPASVVAVSISLPTDKYVGEASRSAFFDALRERLGALPGVSEVAVASQVFGAGSISFVDAGGIDGRAPGAPAGPIVVPTKHVSAGYFRTLRIPLVSGRTFADADEPEAVVISRSLASRLWPDGDAVGRQFRLGAGWPWQTVVGVAGDVEARASDLETTFHVYRRFVPPSAGGGTPPRARGYAERVVLVRADNAAAVVPAIRAAVWSIDANQPVGRVSMVDDLYAAAFGRERFVLQLMAAFGLIAVLLTGAGIFSVLSQVAGRRTREIGLRVALGASSFAIVRLVAGRGAALVIIGMVSGLGGAVALSRFLEGLLFQVRPLDLFSFASVTVLMFAVAAVGCWLPTRRAMRVDPAVALRVE